MKITHTIVVNAAAEQVWQMLGPDFADVARWMAAIPRSEAIEGATLPGAPVRGRNSYLIKKFNGMYQEEIITGYSDSGQKVSFDVIIRNGPKMMPLRGYSSTVMVEDNGDETCRVTWEAEPHIKWFGMPMKSPLMKQLDAGFMRNLEEIKHIAEHGQPHPRKVAILAAEGKVE